MLPHHRVGLPKNRGYIANEAPPPPSCLSLSPIRAFSAIQRRGHSFTPNIVGYPFEWDISLQSKGGHDSIQHSGYSAYRIISAPTPSVAMPPPLRVRHSCIHYRRNTGRTRLTEPSSFPRDPSRRARVQNAIPDCYSGVNTLCSTTVASFQGTKLGIMGLPDTLSFKAV